MELTETMLEMIVGGFRLNGVEVPPGMTKAEFEAWAKEQGFKKKF